MAKITKSIIEIILKESGHKDVEGATARVMSKMKELNATQERNIRGTAEMSSSATKNFSKMSQGLSGVVHVYASLAANIFAVSAAFRAMSEAADYQRMINASKQLSITTGNNYMMVAKSLKEVSANAIDMQTAMQTANLGLAAGFTGQQMEKITKLATQAGIALGRNVPDAIHRLTTAIVKGEPELTDELGIILRLQEATEKYAKSKNKVASDLTTGERLQAVYQQAIERGTPKYGEIDIEAQVFDKLLTSIKEVSKTFLNLVNNIIKPFVNLLGDSKLIIGGIFILLGKILLTKTTHLFGEGLTARLEQIGKSLENIIVKTGEAANKYKYYKSIVSEDKELGVQFEKNVASMIGESIDQSATFKKLPKKLNDKLLSPDNYDFDDFGRAFTDSFGRNVLKAMPKAIRKAIDAGKKEISFGTGDNKVVFGLSKELERTQALAFADTIKYYNQREDALEKMNSSWGGLILKTQSAIAAYSNFENKIKLTGKLGIEAGLTKGFEKVKDNLYEIERRLKNSTELTKKLGKAAFYAGVGIGKISRALDIIGGLIQRLFFYLGVISTIAGVINKIFGFWTGNLGEAKKLLEENTQSFKDIQETIEKTSFRIEGVGDASAYIDKLANVANQYTTILDNVVKSIRKHQESGIFEEFWEGLTGKVEKEQITQIKKGISEAFATLEAIPGGGKAVKEALDALSTDKILIQQKAIAKEAETINAKALKAANELATTQAKIAELGKNNQKVDAKLTTQLWEQEAASSRLSKEAENINKALQERTVKVGGLVQYELKLSDILQGHEDIIQKLLSGDEARIKEAKNLLLEVEKTTGKAGLMEAVMAAINEIIQIATVNAKELGNVLATAASTITNILRGFSQIKDQKLLADIETTRGIVTAMEQMEGPFTDEEITRLTEIKGYLAQMESISAQGMGTAAAQGIIQTNRAYDSLAKKTVRSAQDIQSYLDSQNKALADINVQYGKQTLAVESAKRALAEGTGSKERIAAEELQLSLLNAEKIAIQTNIKKGRELSILEKKSGGGGGKTDKFRAQYAEEDLQYARAIQTLNDKIAKSQYYSLRERAEASKNLFHIEKGILELELKAAEQKRNDAEANIAKAKNENERSKAHLEYAKALNVEFGIRAEYADRIAQREKEMMDAYGKAGMANPELGMLGSIGWAMDDMVREMKNALESWMTTFTNSIKDAFQTGTHAIAEALVTGENNIAKAMSESLKKSAIELIDKGLQQLILNSLPNDLFSNLFGKVQKGEGAETAAQSHHATAMNALTPILEMHSASMERLTAVLGSQINTAITLPGGADTAAAGGTGIASVFSSIFSRIFSFFGFGANGGMLNHIGMYQNGHIATRPELAVIGEGARNEAVVPLPDNRSIPVDLRGQAGNITTNVVINSDGSSDAETDATGQNGANFANLINIAIKKQILEQQRPGGLLYSGRR